MHIHHIIVSKFIKDCNERFQTAFFISWSILVFWKRNSECCSNKSEKPTNVESQWNLLKLYVSKALGLLNKNLVILCTPKRCNCLLSISKVCSQVLDYESHKPAFSSRLLNFRSLKETLWRTSVNDTSKYFQDHDINSLHELCYIFAKIDFTTEKRLKYLAMFSIFASNPNGYLFWSSK